LQRRRFNVAVAKDHISEALVARITSFGAAQIICKAISST
jgi:hypothetical protein